MLLIHVQPDETLTRSSRKSDVIHGLECCLCCPDLGHLLITAWSFEYPSIQIDWHNKGLAVALTRLGNDVVPNSWDNFIQNRYRVFACHRSGLSRTVWRCGVIRLHIRRGISGCVSSRRWAAVSFWLIFNIKKSFLSSTELGMLFGSTFTIKDLNKNSWQSQGNWRSAV